MLGLSLSLPQRKKECTGMSKIMNVWAKEETCNFVKRTEELKKDSSATMFLLKWVKPSEEIDKVEASSFLLRH